MKKISKMLIAAGALLCTILALSCVAYYVGAMIFGLFDANMFYYLALEGDSFIVNAMFLVNYLVSGFGCLGIPVLAAGLALDGFLSDETDIIKKISKVCCSVGAVLCVLLLAAIFVGGNLFGVRLDFDYFGRYPIIAIVQIINSLALLTGALGVPMLGIGAVGKVVCELGLFNKKAQPEATEE